MDSHVPPDFGKDHAVEPANRPHPTDSDDPIGDADETLIRYANHDANAIPGVPQDDTDQRLRTSVATVQSNRATDTGSDSERPPVPSFADLEILGTCGRGGMGTVYRARSTMLDRVVAIKTLSRRIAGHSSLARRLEREAKVVASIDHPNVVRIFDIRHDPAGIPVLVMEFIDGGDLRDRLAAGPPGSRQACSWMIQIASGVAAAHRAKVIHRDLKPSNLLMTQSGDIKVADFGLVRRDTPREDPLSVAGDFIGTPHYASPEQARAESLTPASDVFSLGIILYEMLTGRPPFRAPSPWDVVHDILTEDPAPVRRLAKRVPADLETICHRCLEKNPTSRYADAGQLADDLQRFADGLPINAKPTSGVRRGMKWCRRHPAAATLIGVVALAGIALATVMTVSQRRVRVAFDKTQAALERADAGRDLAVDAMNNLVYDVHDTLMRRGASIEAREEVLRAGIRGLQSILDQPIGSDIDATRLKLADAHQRLAGLLYQQSKIEAATTEYERALQLAKASDQFDAAKLHATITVNLADFYFRQMKIDPCLAHATRAERELEQLTHDRPDDRELARTRISNQRTMALVSAIRGDLESAIESAQQATLAADEFLRDDPKDRPALDLVVKTTSDLASFHATAGNVAASLDHYRMVMKRLETLDPFQTDDVPVRKSYFNAMLESSVLLARQMRYGEAIDGLRTVREAYDALVEAEPQRFGFRLRLAYVHQRLAETHWAVDDPIASGTHATEAIDQYQRVIRMNPATVIQGTQIAACYRLLAEIEIRGGNPEAAKKMLGSACDALRPTLSFNGVQDLLDHCEALRRALGGQPRDDTDKSAGHDQWDPRDSQRIERGIALLRTAKDIPEQRFLADADAVSEDAADANHPVVATTLRYWIAAAHGYRHAERTARDGDAAGAAEEAKRTHRSLQTYLKQPGSDPEIVRKDPAFISLRGDAAGAR